MRALWLLPLLVGCGCGADPGRALGPAEPAPAPRSTREPAPADARTSRCVLAADGPALSIPLADERWRVHGFPMSSPDDGVALEARGCTWSSVRGDPVSGRLYFEIFSPDEAPTESPEALVEWLRSIGYFDGEPAAREPGTAELLGRAVPYAHLVGRPRLAPRESHVLALGAEHAGRDVVVVAIFPAEGEREEAVLRLSEIRGE